MGGRGAAYKEQRPEQADFFQAGAAAQKQEQEQDQEQDQEQE
jgi:hypothetical protein